MPYIKRLGTPISPTAQYIVVAPSTATVQVLAVFVPWAVTREISVDKTCSFCMFDERELNILINLMVVNVVDSEAIDKLNTGG